MEAEPITMPSIVSRKRVLLARKLSMARLTVSRKAIVCRALRRVRSKLEFARFRRPAVSVASFGGLVTLVDIGCACILAHFQYRSLLPVWASGVGGGVFTIAHDRTD